LPQPQDENGVHRRPRHTWRIIRMRSTGAAAAARMLLGSIKLRPIS
jgi:hypothetical protein